MFKNFKYHLNMTYEDDITLKTSKVTIKKPTNKRKSKEFSMLFASILKTIWNGIIFFISKFKYLLIAIALFTFLFFIYEYYTKERNKDSISKIDIVEINKELNNTIKVSNDIIDINSNFNNKAIEIINSNNINKNNINNIINEMKNNNSNKTNSNNLLSKSNSNINDNTILEENIEPIKSEKIQSEELDILETSSKVIALTKLSELMDKEIIELPDLV